MREPCPFSRADGAGSRCGPRSSWARHCRGTPPWRGERLARGGDSDPALSDGGLIGEWAGLAIGVALSLPIGLTVVLATVLAYTSGFGLTMWPLLRRGMRLWPALTTVFVGEVVSIGVMEAVMNAVDYSMGGMGVRSLSAPRYWEALAVASVAGFLAAWPVNFWLLGRHMKTCHPDAAQHSGA